MTDIRSHLARGQVIPAHPLALTAARTLDERHQRALTRYYVAAGAGGIAVGVHTTQFQIRDRKHGLLAPVLALAAETAAASLRADPRPFARIAGVCGDTKQALAEARLAHDLGYDAALVSLGALHDASEPKLLEHCREIGEILPLFGFYLQPAVGGRVLRYEFWRGFAQIPQVVAIKIAPFNRYQTLDVVRAVADSDRTDIALYTGNDDQIVLDLLTDFPRLGHSERAPRIVGGLLGQWSVWTHRAVEMLEEIRVARDTATINGGWLTRAAALTDANGALFDVRHAFAGCIAGLHEILRRQRLLAGIWCLDPNEGLSEGQLEEIERATRVHPELTDDEFVAAHVDEWLR
ncbi:MAG TPA: dihydrodipicolinate synthase family protein [Gemmatimonadaceae bacterium]|nr:dihydrodipicolinate synthase family protein [Gemmatimonadaceae bacterium]